MSEWEPIETAPRNGDAFLFDTIDLETGMSIGYFGPDGALRSIFNGKKIGPHVTPPKFWRPLPKPPTTGDK